MCRHGSALMEMKPKAPALPQRATWPITLARLASIVLLIILANIGVSWLIDKLELQFFPEHLKFVERTVLSVLFCTYA